ncbi:hypothetical protein [Rosenbergiella epipactidis]|uniref:hypothetical protein n=1 Tax=Rosenbergiella epipactidis TaxID=1544694 RepID=UPI001F4D7E13|nr:hypothetical protein [Rosenbergiella epipactidis]
MSEELKRYNKQDFYRFFREFDAAVCEASAVSNSIGVKEAEWHIAFATHVFVRICNHAEAMAGAIPESRWAKKDSYSWDLSFVAPHARAIIEGNLLFYYVSKKPSSDEELRTKINVMHMNDCVRRISFFEEGTSDYIGLNKQKDELTERLNSIDYFQNLSGPTKKRCLNGKALMIPSRDELLIEMGEDVRAFNIMFDFLSNYTHILPISYYRMEANGRGTGCFNEVDLNYICIFMEQCTQILRSQTDKIVDFFPDLSKVRKGIRSKSTFAPKIKK